MSYLRLSGHYIHKPSLILQLAEAVVLLGTVYLGYFVHRGRLPFDLGNLLPTALTFTVVITLAMVAMGVYTARLREGFIGMMLRTAVAYFLIGGLGLAMAFYLIPPLTISRGELAVTTLISFATLTLFRLLTDQLVPRDAFKRRVVVLGTGEAALKIALRMRRRSDQRGFTLQGYLRPQGTEDVLGQYGLSSEPVADNLLEWCRQRDIDEIVVAGADDLEAMAQPQPELLAQLLECRMAGIEVSHLLEFIEREAGKLDLDLLSPNWMVYASGFRNTLGHRAIKRGFDLVTASLVLVLSTPVILLTALALWLEGGLKKPVLYRQTRTGLDGRNFELVKFRSMHLDAESDGQPKWADKRDARVTRVGEIIRKARIDELPQLFNVLRGEMSLVGPRPERPEFVAQLAGEVPFYNERHRIKPGITGWAQLSYPYGASVQDTREKVQYDLYYLKNHSLLLDLIILVQTVQVVLIGDGAR